MGNVIGITGESGSGKTCSFRNFDPETVGIFNVSGKPLSFKGTLPMCKTSDMKLIANEIRKNNRDIYLIDDAGLLMTFFLFDKVNETGYGKFTQVAKDFYDLVQTAIRDTSDNTNIYFVMHTERSEDGARIKMKTAGRMIDNQLTLESLFSIVLYCVTDGRKHSFITQSDGVTTAKSPMGMFPLEIDNDLKAVDDTIREYYGMKPARKGSPEQKKQTAKASVEVAKKIPG